MTAKPLIRIVDDDEALTASSAMLLEAMGWDVAVWHSGGAFLDEADLMRPGCLVLDVRMPGLTGPRCSGRTRKTRFKPPHSLSLRARQHSDGCACHAPRRSRFSRKTR